MEPHFGFRAFQLNACPVGTFFVPPAKFRQVSCMLSTLFLIVVVLIHTLNPKPFFFVRQEPSSQNTTAHPPLQIVDQGFYAGSFHSGFEKGVSNDFYCRFISLYTGFLSCRLPAKSSFPWLKRFEGVSRALRS